jgi:hypothetical protein
VVELESGSDQGGAVASICGDIFSFPSLYVLYIRNAVVFIISSIYTLFFLKL